MRLLAVLLFVTVLHAADAEDRVRDSASVLTEIMSVKDRSIPQDLLDKAECAIVIPGLKKGAFFVGAKYGRGFMSCRKQSAGWSAPAGVRVEGGSFGFQIGGSETDLVMLVLNRRGAEKLMSSKFTLGGDASVAAGPVGRSTTAETDATMHAEMLSWSRTRGVFAGISLKGATLRPDETANQELYSKKLVTRDIVMGSVEETEAGKPLVSLLTKYSGRH